MYQFSASLRYFYCFRRVFFTVTARARSIASNPLQILANADVKTANPSSQITNKTIKSIQFTEPGTQWQPLGHIWGSTFGGFYFLQQAAGMKLSS